MEEVEVLGHLLTVEGIKPTAVKIEAIKRWKQPTNLTKLQSFLGTVNYYWNFIANFAKMAKRLNELMRKNTVFEWTNEC